MATLLLRGGRIIDPATRLDETGDLWLTDGVISAGPPADRRADQVLDVSGCIVAPGLVDCRVVLGEPGFDEDETIESGTRSALAGGFTTVAALPETSPVVDTRSAAEYVSRQAERAGGCRVLPLGAVTKGREGEELSEMAQLLEGGAVAFSDGKRPIANAEVMRRALQYAGMRGRTILHHPQAPELVARGVMHEGYYSTVLGLAGIPAAAEEIMVRRDIALAELTGGRVHLMGVSTLHSVEELRQARSRGLRVTADVTPFHLLLTDDRLESFDPNYKFDPPLRSAEHVAALYEGLADGTLSVISADHRPFADEKKMRELNEAPAGAVGLETLIPLCIKALILPGRMSWLDLLARLTIGPAEVLGVDCGRLAPGRPADVTVIDPEKRWTIDADQFVSKSRNTPFHGEAVQGAVRATIVGGRVLFSASAGQPCLLKD